MSRYNIYSNADYQKLKAAQKAAAALLPMCDDAEQCGIEVEEYRDLVQETQRTLSEIESRFMTPAPRK